jgi:leucyl aminopeptidase (aminopeptidase T)
MLDRKSMDADFQRRAFSTLLHSCLNLEPRDDLLVIYDESFEPFFGTFEDVVITESIPTTFLYITTAYQAAVIAWSRTAGRDAVRLPAGITAAIDQSTAILNLLDSIPAHASLRRAINLRTRQYNCRLATIPGISPQILSTVVESNTEKILKDCEAVAWALGEAHLAELISYDTNGHEYRLVMELEGWDNEPMMSPGVIVPGSWGNVPPGETFCCPEPATVQGKVCINGSIRGHVLGPSQAVVLDFERGELAGWNPECESSPAMAFLEGERARAERDGDDNWNIFAELGVGLNPAVRELTGNPLFDEKAMGTVHVAVGDNSNFGHSIVSHTHTDLVSVRPTLRLDGRELMSRGVIPEGLIESWRRLPPLAELNAPPDARVVLKEKVDFADGVLRRRLSKAYRIGFVAMADEKTSRQLQQLCDVLRVHGAFRLSNLLQVHTEFEGVPTMDLLKILHHYRVLGFFKP